MQLLEQSQHFGAAYCTWVLKDKKVNGIPVLACLMPVIFNFFFVGAELAYLFMPNEIVLGTLINGSFVAIGELIFSSYWLLPSQSIR